jgi:60S ribosome subunit biogenesis protein NIP7
VERETERERDRERRETESSPDVLDLTCSPMHPFTAQYKVWVKPSAEMSFLYGKHVLKAGLGRITENTPKYQGVVVLSMSDVPLGFGVTAMSTQECRRADPGAVVCFNQADTGEYLRDEETI